VKAAIDAVGGVGAPRVDQAEQIPLLPEVQPVLPLGGSGNAEQVVAAERGAGRPQGAKNRRTQEWIDQMLAIHKVSPGEFLMRVMLKDLQELRTELKCDLLEAFDRKLDAATALLPYFHQKLPQAIELDRGIMDLIINVGSAPVKTLDAKATSVEVLEPKKSEQNQ